MGYIQRITPTPRIPCRPGWCLQYVRQAFGLPARHPTATAAWHASTTQHRGRDFPPGLWTPVWYGLAREPAGHVVLLAPDGSCYSTSDNSTTPHHHPDLADLERFYARHGMALSYRGWTEDVAGYPVIDHAHLQAAGAAAASPPPEWDDMASKQDLKDALYEVITEPAVLDRIALAILHRPAHLVDPTGTTGTITGTTTLARKINWAAHNDAQILNAIVDVANRLPVAAPALAPEALDVPEPAPEVVL